MPSDRQRRLRKLGNAIRANSLGEMGARERARTWFLRSKLAGDLVKEEDAHGNLIIRAADAPYAHRVAN